MAITVADRGTGTNNSANTSWTLAPGSNFAAGSMAVLVVAADNGAASGAANDLGVVTDSHGNEWRQLIIPLFDNGAASAGVQGAIYCTEMQHGVLTTGSTITVRTGASATAKAWTLKEIIPTSGSFRIAYVTGGVNAGSTATAPTVTTGSITNGDCVIGASFTEYGTAEVVTGDADATSGSWSTQQTTSIGSTTSGMCVSAQHKIVTATATQTFNPTLGTSADTILGWVQFTEAARSTKKMRELIASEGPISVPR